MPSPPAGGGRFALRAVRHAAGDALEKRGDDRALGREAAALAALAGAPGVPHVLERSPGLLVTRRLPGAPRDAGDVSAGGWHRLGALLRALHGRAAHERARQPDGTSHADARAYARARRADAGRAARAAGTPPPPDATPPAFDGPFRRIHGDLVLANVVWDGDEPGLVDWEFSRPSDPAEDLAYLAAVNRLTGDARDAVARGYDDPAASARAAWWEPVVVAEAAAWWRSHGEPDRADALLTPVRDVG